MASNWLTNRGKLLLMQGAWDDEGASDIVMGLVEGTTIPTSADTEAEIQDLNTVSEFLALAGVDEPTATNYARTALTRTNAAEDDTNNRVDLDAADYTLTSVANNGDSVIGGFYYNVVTSDTDHELMGVFWLDTAVTFNGSNIDVAIADLVRAS